MSERASERKRIYLCAMQTETVETRCILWQDESPWVRMSVCKYSKLLVMFINWMYTVFCTQLSLSMLRDLVSSLRI